MKDTILDILSEIVEDVDFDTCTTLIDDGILSSLDIIQLIGALNDEFDLSPRPRSFRRTSTAWTRWLRWSRAFPRSKRASICSRK